METFFTFLEKRVDDCASLLCIGLDPHIEDLPEPTAAAARDFCLNLVKKTARYAAAFKPNAAFFEYFGGKGWDVLGEVIQAIQVESDRYGSKIPVILDAKRGDIASTARAYAYSVFHQLKADALTVNPYLGWDSMEPFLAEPEKGIFVLCKTSNPGSGDLQDQHLEMGTVYERVARQAQSLNQRNNIGLVVGATHIEALTQVRQSAPELWILVPGVGAQGGELEAALQAGWRKKGGGVLVNVSRSISRSDDPGKAASELRDEIINITYSHQHKGFSASQVQEPLKLRLADDLLDAGCIKFGEFTLKSGATSPIYIDLRELVSHPELLSRVGRAYLPILQTLDFDRLAGLPYAAIPIVTTISLQGGFPFIYPRKESKGYGTNAEIEGLYSSGETVVLIDDLATTGGSKFEAIDKLTGAGLKVRDIVVLIDRESGAKQALAQEGFNMIAHWEMENRVPADLIAKTRIFITGG